MSYTFPSNPPQADDLSILAANSTEIRQLSMNWWTPVLTVGSRTIKLQAKNSAAVVFTLDHTGPFGVNPPYLKARPIN